ncbi:MAG TPA: DUF58 domain-containing protein [Rhodospirillaceae bacterium]|nr:MAG: hypothetical protein A2018_07385 [Alphaproteobacteria bacterium GWF2_58_20]HAU29297.1 DUF58 domain-containing protein [Rhodospirillaceae bacterium]
MTKPDALVDHAARLAEALPPLLLAAERVAQAVAAGGHGRKKSGPGESFWQFRNYLPGDEPRRINWRKSAQTGLTLIRETEWATAQSVFLWRDASPSMDFRSKPRLPTKRQRAELLLMAMGCLLSRGGERMALIEDSAPASNGKHALAAMATALSRQESGNSLPRLKRDIPSGSHILLVGDFLAPPDTLKPFLSSLASKGCRGILLQVLDPAETRFPYRGRLLAEGCEGEGSLLISSAGTLRKAYLARLATQQAEMQALARPLGWDFRVHDTSQPPRSALLALYGSLARGTHR